MSAKMHYLLTSGQVRGLYGCGFHWWVKNPHDQLVRQLDWASHALESRTDLKMLLVCQRSLTKYDDMDRRDDEPSTYVSLLLFEQWQWAALHATLYSLCMPFMNGAPE